MLKAGDLQDLMTMCFQKLIKGKRSESLSFNLEYIKDRNTILNHCIPFFFDDQTSSSFDEALNHYLQSLGKEKKYLKEIDTEKKFTLSVLENIQDKYVSFLAETIVKVKTGKMSNSTGQTMAFLYDIPNDRILSLNDILKPQYAEEIMNSHFSNHLYLSLSSLVWGKKVGNGIHLNQIDFLNHADQFTDEFKQQVNLDAEIAAYHARLSERAKEVAEGTYTPDNKVFDVVEHMPEFTGGQAALLKWIADNIKYPTIAEENGIQGRVVCTFVVEPDGSITDVKVARSIDPSLDKEAIRVLKEMPRWNPGRQNGKRVRVRYTAPVTFKLQ